MLTAIYRITQTAALLLASAVFLALFQIPANPYIAFGLTASLIGFAWTDRSVKRYIAVAALGAAYAALYRKLGGTVDHYSGWWIAYPTGMLGLGAIVVSMLRWFWSDEDGETLKNNVVTQAAIPALCAISSLFVGNAIRWTPKTYDYTVYNFDSSLGAASFVLGRFMAAHPGIYQFCAGIYNALPLWAGLGWILLSVAPARRNWRPRACFIALGVAGFCLYQLCPVAGPAYRFAGSFPWRQPDPASLPAGPAFLIPCARNAMPSLHIAWAMLLVYCSLEWKWAIRAVCVVIAMVTLAAMLGSGEHYLIDAVVSFPLLASLIAGGMRRLAISAGAGTVTVFWLLAFRSGAAIALPDSARIVAAILTIVLGSAAMIALHRGATGIEKSPQAAAGRLSPVKL